MKIGRKMSECLEAYINLGEACWEQVVNVVVDHPFYNTVLAKDIARDHIHGVGYSKDEL